MGEKLLLYVGLVVLIMVLLLGKSGNVPILGGDGGPRFSSANVVNSSSSIDTVGAVIITNASNTGTWFRITNQTPRQVYCGAAVTSTGLLFGGVFLAPISSSTGSNIWEMYGVGGPISCIADASGGVVNFSYVAR